MKKVLLVWTRRALVISLYAAALSTLTVFFVPLAVAAALYDRVRSQPWTATRALVFFVWYLACELAGVAASFAIWVVSGRRHDRFLDWNYGLQRWWTRMLARGGFRIFDIELDIDPSDYRFGQRPVLIFVRHASVADTILAAMLIAVPHRTRLRYVLKRELLWDPCLDIVGNRLPNVFVRRDSVQTERELASVAALATDLGPADGVLIYPEGTRFSPAKKARVIAKLREQGREDAAREAESLRHLLRPRSGGALALLEAARDADVIFLAHTGFEGSASFDRFFNGGLIGRTVRAELRVVRSQDVPRDPAARRAWLMENWRQVDSFIDAHEKETGGRHRERNAEVVVDQPVQFEE